MAAYTPAALERTGRIADAWHPVGVPLAIAQEMFEGVRASAEKAGRDPSALELVVRGNTVVTDTPLGDERWEFTGTPEQIAGDIAKAREIGADELVLDPAPDPGVRTADDFLGRLELLARLAKESAGTPA
jgi:alkanesulfonate monooxygenase SsuD/methylene tetrahydromethanopterin reductase-like flavin-dependent oxidoreductase (luciferase family)